MSKFRIKLKLQGLELEVEGSREDAPAIAEQLGRQFVGLLQPAAALAAGEQEEHVPARPATAQSVVGTVPAVTSGGKKGRKKRNAPRADAGNGATEGNDGDNAALEWEHDAARWGLPKQPWSTVQKAIWLLYVAGQSTETKELSSGQIVATHTKQFRSAGPILKHNVTRDLKAIARGRGAKVSMDTGSEPPVWFLTDGGIEYAKTLVAEATGGPAAAPVVDGATPPTE